MLESTPTRHRPALSITLIALFVVSSLLLGLIGGVTGFVLLSTSNLPVVESTRELLGLNGESSLAIPVRQTVRLDESSAIIDAANKVMPAVVAISASQQVIDFFGRTSTQETGGGSGFIITSDGLIITNKHVVSAVADYKVVLNDGRILDAKVQAIDSLNDLAVLKVEARDLPTVELGTSDDLKVGQNVIAVGNALGEFRNSVTHGVVSAKQRSISAGTGSASERLTDLIQTDAAINPGNSGGPLVNLNGQVVGINTAIASTTGGSIGVGFAISMDSVKNVITSVRRTGEIVRPFLGVRYIVVNPVVKAQNSLTVDYGALVVKGDGEDELAVLPGSPADKAGIRENDILLEINGEQINEDAPLAKRLQKYEVGDTVTVKLQRGGEEQTVRLVLEKLP